MNKDERQAERRKLHQIYLDHDIAGFREFITARSTKYPELVPFVSEKDEVLSDLMFNMKSQLMYLGPVWQEARNQMRYKTFWESQARDPAEIPACVKCKHFRDAPSEKEEPCMHLGATPYDISCLAFEPIN